MRRRLRPFLHTIVHGVVSIGRTGRIIETRVLFRSSQRSGYRSGWSGIRLARFVLILAILPHGVRVDDKRCMRTQREKEGRERAFTRTKRERMIPGEGELLCD